MDRTPILVRFPDELLRRLNERTRNGQRNEFIIQLVERGLAEADEDDRFFAGFAAGTEQAIQKLEAQAWLTKRAGQLVKGGMNPTDAMVEATFQWNKRARDG